MNPTGMKHLRTFDCSNKCHSPGQLRSRDWPPCRLARPARDSEMHLAYRHIGEYFRCFPGPNQHILQSVLVPHRHAGTSRPLECIENDTPQHSLPYIRGSGCWARIGWWEMIDLFLAKARIARSGKFSPEKSLELYCPFIFLFLGSFQIFR